MQLKIHPIDLRLRSRFSTSHSSRLIQPTLVVELSEGGYSGFGEATANTYFGVTREHIINEIELTRQYLETTSLISPEEMYDQLKDLSAEPFALCAIDQACYDLWGKKHHLFTRNFWSTTQKYAPKTSYTLGIDSVKSMVENLLAHPWPLYKIKLGFVDDMECVRELRKHTDSPFIVDANCGWSVAQAIENSKELARMNVLLIEQPLDPQDWAGAKKMFLKSALPVFADEACRSIDDIIPCSTRFHGINIKLTKCGGITPASRMIVIARNAGLQVMIGCMTESSVGISAAAQLASQANYMDIDGALLLAKDPAKGVDIEMGHIIYPKDIYGNGAQLLSN